MPNSSLSYYDNWFGPKQKLIRGGVNGELVAFAGGRQIGKSMMSKMIMNSRYGKVAQRWSGTNLEITKAYKGEWKVVPPAAVSLVEFEDWCTEMMGDPGRNPRYRWRKAQTSYGIYFLRDEKDLLMLRLKWA